MWVKVLHGEWAGKTIDMARCDALPMIAKGFALEVGQNDPARHIERAVVADALEYRNQPSVVVVPMPAEKENQQEPEVK